MANGTNKAEEFVTAHCDRTFLSLWGMANPFGDDPGKELCDYIVVCDPDVIIFSVKEVGLTPKAEPHGVERWLRKAVDNSLKQIYGAERALACLDRVKDRRGRVINLPASQKRQLHRIAVAFGSGGHVPLAMGDFGHGFVHIMEERSFPTLLRELDTISDLSAYLTHKAALIEANRRVFFSGEENLLALYLSGNRALPPGDVLFVDEDFWRAFTDSREYKARREADRASYAWDNVIEYVTKDLQKGDLLYADPPDEAERVLRVMAREDRLCRRFLGESLSEVLLGGRVRSRMVQSMSGVVYVFLGLPRGEDRQYRIAELGLRCKVARGQFRDAITVVGIASERGDDRKPGLSFDLLLLEQAEWTDADEQQVVRIKEELGFFSNPETSSRRVDEYPKADAETESS